MSEIYRQHCTGGHCFWPVFFDYLKALMIHKDAKFKAIPHKHQYTWFVALWNDKTYEQ